MDLSNYILLEGETNPELTFEATDDDDGRIFMLKASNQWGEKFSRDAYLGTHEDAINYFNRVESLGGVVDNKPAINKFFRNLDSYGLRTYIRDAYLFCGVSYEGLPAKLISEDVSTLTLENFVSGDYKRNGLLAGLKGNGVSSSISTHLKNLVALPQSLSSFITEDDFTTGHNSYIGCFRQLYLSSLKRSGTQIRYCNHGSNQADYASWNPPDWNSRYILGQSREDDTRSRYLYSDGELVASNTTDRTFSGGVPQYRLFSSTYGSNTSTEDYPVEFWPGRMSFAHIGHPMSDIEVEKLNTVVQQLMTDLGVK